MTTFLVFAGSILVLVGVHEAGHFLVARAFGVYIKEFAIGFGPKVLSFQGKETKYTLRLIPFGGYVKMAGEDQLEQGSTIPSNRMLYSKPPYARALISLAGPMTNLAFAFLITLAVIWALSFPVMQVSGVVPGSPAASVLEFGDRVLTMDGRRILMRDQITSAVAASAGSPIEIALEREGERLAFFVQPAFVAEEDRYRLGAYFSPAAMTNQLIALPSDSLLGQRGVQPGDRIVAVNGQPTDTLLAIEIEATQALSEGMLTLALSRNAEIREIDVPVGERTLTEVFDGARFADLGVITRRAHFAEGISLACIQFVGYIRALAEVIQSVVTGRVAAGDVFQGPIGVAQVLGEGVRVGASFFFQLLAFLSLNFGLINLIPFPALDGSRATFAVVEWVRGKPVSPQREGVIHAIGFFILIGLMILITYQDILRLVR